MIMMDEVANFQMMTWRVVVCLRTTGGAVDPRWIGLISSRGMLKFNRYAIVLAVVLGGVLTPSTDPFTQCLLAAPFLALQHFNSGGLADSSGRVVARRGLDRGGHSPAGRIAPQLFDLSTADDPGRWLAGPALPSSRTEVRSGPVLGRLRHRLGLSAGSRRRI